MSGVPMDNGNHRVTLDRVLFRVSVRHLALITVSLPLVSLLICFVTSMLFDFTLVNTTVCKVYNFCPSVSAITGISPQRYIWRVGVALHTAPRFLLASLYRTHYSEMVKFVASDSLIRYQNIVRLNYWLNIIEIMGLVGVTYISNKENYGLTDMIGFWLYFQHYHVSECTIRMMTLNLLFIAFSGIYIYPFVPKIGGAVHEKIFIVFMTASIAYMLTSCLACNLVRHPEMTEMERLSLRAKWILLFIISTFTTGLLFFFYKHRVHCQELAFSWFSMCEYVICAANMAFHGLIIWDLGDKDIFVGQQLLANGDLVRPKKE